MIPISRFFYDEVFTIAYREKEKAGSSGLLEDNKKPFTCMPVSSKHWYADPMLFEHHGVNYIFYEVYRRIQAKGVIGYSIIRPDGSLTEPKVILEKEYHLSYPFVFKAGEKIYMMPETGESRNIQLYEAVSFPDQWSLKNVFIDNILAADTTVLWFNNTAWMFTAEYNEKSPFETRLLRCILKDVDSRLKRDNFMVLNDFNAFTRPAGRFFTHQDEWIRPSQDCSDKFYGKALLFNKIEEINENGYKETLLKKVFPGDIPTDSKYVLIGTHTYGTNDHYEVVDVKFKLFNFPLKYVRHLMNFIRRYLK